MDNNHITKLGELKQLIDGLWGKVTTAISNAVSGLLSKSEAEETYATNDGSNATGTWGIDISGNAVAAGSVSPQSDYEGYLELKPTATTLDVFRGDCDVDGSLLNAIKNKVNSPILENSDNRSATFFGRFDLSANATLMSLLGTGTYPFYFVSLSRQSGFVIISSTSSFHNIVGAITGRKPVISYLGNFVHASVNTALGSSTRPVYINPNGFAVACDFNTVVIVSGGTVTFYPNKLHYIFTNTTGYAYVGNIDPSTIVENVLYTFDSRKSPGGNGIKFSAKSGYTLYYDATSESLASAKTYTIGTSRLHTKMVRTGTSIYILAY